VSALAPSLLPPAGGGGWGAMTAGRWDAFLRWLRAEAILGEDDTMAAEDLFTNEFLPGGGGGGGGTS
jgi:hypothetical protein